MLGATEKDNSKECGEETDDIKKETVGRFDDLLTVAEGFEEQKFSDIQILADASSHVDYLPTAINKEAQTENNFTFSIRVIIEDEGKLTYFIGFIDTDMFWICFWFIAKNQIFQKRNSILSLEDHLFHISISTVWLGNFPLGSKLISGGGGVVAIRMSWFAFFEKIHSRGDVYSRLESR